MEIHGLSLTFSPIGYNRQSTEKDNNVRNKDEAIELSIAKNSHNPQLYRGLSPDVIKETLDSTYRWFKSLGLMDQYNIYKLTDTCTLKALNA